MKSGKFGDVAVAWTSLARRSDVARTSLERRFAVARMSQRGGHLGAQHYQPLNSLKTGPFAGKGWNRGQKPSREQPRRRAKKGVIRGEPRKRISRDPFTLPVHVNALFQPCLNPFTSPVHVTRSRYPFTLPGHVTRSRYPFTLPVYAHVTRSRYPFTSTSPVHVTRSRYPVTLPVHVTRF